METCHAHHSFGEVGGRGYHPSAVGTWERGTCDPDGVEEDWGYAASWVGVIGSIAKPCGVLERGTSDFWVVET